MFERHDEMPTPLFFVVGPEKEFHSFHGQCFEINQNKLAPWLLFEFIMSRSS